MPFVYEIQKGRSVARAAFGWCICPRKSKLLGDLGDGADRALVLAVGAADAVAFIDDGANVVLELDDASGACVDASAAADAIRSSDNRMHESSSPRLARQL